jgi:hypothetical protein
VNIVENHEPSFFVFFRNAGNQIKQSDNINFNQDVYFAWENNIFHSYRSNTF